MDEEISYHFDNETGFWSGRTCWPLTNQETVPDRTSAELERIVDAPYAGYEDIDNALRSYLEFTGRFKRTKETLTLARTWRLTSERGVSAIGI